MPAGFRHTWWVALVATMTACATATPPPRGLALPPDSAGGPPRGLRLAEARFERVAKVDGISIFEHPTSDLIRIGAEGRLPAPPSEVQKVLLDFPRHADVLERVAVCRILSRGPNELSLYQRLELPVVSDRDFTLRVTWGEAPARRWIRYRAVRAGPPAEDGVVRVTRNHGGWDLLPIEGGRATWARYQSNLDLAGSLPVWMTKSGAVDELPSLFRAMCRLLPSPYARECAP